MCPVAANANDQIDKIDIFRRTRYSEWMPLCNEIRARKGTRSIFNSLHLRRAKSARSVIFVARLIAQGRHTQANEGAGLKDKIRRAPDMKTHGIGEKSHAFERRCLSELQESQSNVDGEECDATDKPFPVVWSMQRERKLEGPDENVRQFEDAVAETASIAEARLAEDCHDEEESNEDDSRAKPAPIDPAGRVNRLLTGGVCSDMP